MHGLQNIKGWALTFSNPKHPSSKQIPWKPSTETTRNIQHQGETEPSHLIWFIQSNLDFIKTLSRPSMPSLRLRRVFKEKSRRAALIGRDISITEMPRQRPTKRLPRKLDLMPLGSRTRRPCLGSWSQDEAQLQVHKTYYGLQDN